MANFQVVSSFLQGQSYNTFPKTLASLGLTKYFDGSQLTVFVPSDAAFLSANNNARSYTFNTSDTGLMTMIMEYHLSPGHRDLSGIGLNDIHTLLPTSLAADLETNSPQSLCVHRTLAPGNGSAVVEILNQKVSPRFNGTASLGNVTFYFIDTVLGIPSYYNWESENTQEMTQWRALSLDSTGLDIMDYDGVTVIAPYDQAWALSHILNNSQNTDVTLLYGNHLIPDHTVYSPDFTAGTYQSASGLNYAFSLSPEGHYVVTLNGTSANITTSDILMSNGVIHLIDAPLWHIEDPSGALGSSNSSSFTSPSPTNTSASPSTHAGSKNSLSTGAVVGIAIAVAVAFLSALIIFVGLRRRHQTHVELINRRRESIDECDMPDLPPEALRTSPFTSQVNLMEETRNETALGTPRSPPPTLSGKRPLTRLGVRSSNMSVSSDDRADPSPGTPAQMTESSSLPVSEEVVERLLQTLAQRIDRGPGIQEHVVDDTAPPGYPKYS